MSAIIIIENVNINEAVKTLCLHALNNSYKVTAAAEMLGVTPRTVHHYIKRFNIKYCYDQKQYIIKNKQHANS